MGDNAIHLWFLQFCNAALRANLCSLSLPQGVISFANSLKMIKKNSHFYFIFQHNTTSWYYLHKFPILNEKQLFFTLLVFTWFQLLLNNHCLFEIIFHCNLSQIKQSWMKIWVKGYHLHKVSAHKFKSITVCHTFEQLCPFFPSVLHSFFLAFLIRINSSLFAAS